MQFDKKFTDDELLELLKKGHSNKECAEILKVNAASITRRTQKLTRKGWSPQHNWTQTVPDGYMIKGVSQYVNNETGKVLRSWVKSDIDKERQVKIIQELTDKLIKDLPSYPELTRQRHTVYEDMMAVYPLGDPHIGMLSWAEETGENWDLKIAEETFIKLFSRVVAAAPPCKQALIANLGDYFHYDNMEGVTSRSGHHLDTDGRYAKMIDVGIDIMINMINLALKYHEKVIVTTTIGNHDDTGAIWLAKMLKRLYANNPRVEIQDSPSPFHYVEFGKVLLGMHHGHTSKMDKLAGVMAADQAEAWGRTKHRMWLTGHIHHDSDKEFPGVRVRSFRTLAAKDSYAAWGGWRSGRDIKALVFHKELGKVEEHEVNIDATLST